MKELEQKNNEGASVMLKRFRFKNCYSFKSETELSMEAVFAMKDHVDFIRVKGNNESPEYLLPVAAIYGANAGGKSNIIQALRDCAMNICERPAASDSLMFRPLKNRRFALLQTANDAFEHELNLIIGNTEYVYNYTATNTKVLSEHLESRAIGTNSKTKRILTRDARGVRFETDNQEHISLVDEIAQNRKDALLANTLGWAGIEPFASIFRWCESVLFATKVLSDNERTFALSKLAAWIEENDLNKKNLSAFISRFDESVSFVDSFDETETARNNKENATKPREKHYQLILAHKTEKKAVFFPVQWESDGTKKLLELYIPLSDALKYGRPLVIDELDVMLHPRIFQRLVAMFNNRDENPNGAQLIFTAHNTIIMDREYLRRDEVHIVEKNQNGVSSICRISEYEDDEGKKIRMDARYDKLYLDGVLGAMHDNFFDAKV